MIAQIFRNRLLQCLSILVVLSTKMLTQVSGATLSSEATHRSSPYCAGSPDTQFQPACGNTGEMIAVKSIQHGTKLTAICGLLNTSDGCCQYDSGDCFIPYTADATSSLFEECSGKQVCPGSNPASVDSSSCGDVYPEFGHYYTMEHYCLPNRRISQFCSTKSKTVTGDLLYLQNQEYPNPIRTDETSCTCSIETKSCESQINVYILHLDLSTGTPGVCNSNQKLSITDGGTTHTYTCSDDNDYVITLKMTSTSNYITVQLDNPDGIGNGRLWLGFEATNSAHELSVNCPARDQTLCMDCPSLTAPSGGDVAYSTTTYLSEATYTCNTGYALIGDTTRACGDDGTWSGSEPTCQIRDCGSPGDVQYGEFAGSTLFTYDAQIVCWYGFAGSDAITCSAGAVWGALPTCSAIDCGSPTIPSGTISSDTAYNDTTEVTCDTGYQGGGRAFCLTSGDWYTLFPQCKPVECWEPDIPDGRLSTGSDTVYGGSATVECDPGFEVIGSNVATCLFDGNWDTLPTCEAKDCGTPTIAHGSLTTDSSTLYGGTAEVVCDTGYLGFGFATCLTTGLWDTANIPPCSPIDCGIPFVYHGFLTGTMETVYDGTASIGCEPGYESGGTATCLDTGLWDESSMPTCDPVDCGASVDANGALDGDSFFAGSAKIVCNTGYTGGGTITCQDNAVWDMSAATTCTLVDCGNPGDPNGKLVGVSTYGGSPSIACNTGFVGGGQITCLPSGEWDKTFVTSCVLADCGPLTAPTYGDVAVSTTTYGSSAGFSCGPLYQMSGNSVLTCNANGAWSSAPPTCIDIDCPGLSAPTFGSLSSDHVTVGTTTFVYCNPGYSLFGLSPLTCETGGTWDDVVGVCELDCPALTKPTYGTLSTEDVMEATIVEVTCDNGYTMFGDAILECLNGGTWNTTVPDCIRECGTLDDPINGYVSQPDGTTLNDVSTYNCSTGYYLSHTDSRVCQSDGSWSNTLPTCIIYDCHEVMPPENGSVTYPTGTTYDETLEYSCDTGYDLIGPSNRTCQSDGTWDLTDPYCQIRDCGPIASPTDGTVDTAEGTVYLSVAVFDCNIGYTMAGSATSMCEATASWSDPTPDCNINDCGPLSSPVDGSVDYVTTTYNSSALYSCDTGYYLSGVSSSTCQADSSWSDEAPTCPIKDCGLLESPADGTLIYSNSATTYQEVATFSCDIGHDLIGDVTRECMEDGMWEGASPICQIKDCGPLPDPINGVVNTSTGTTYTEVANYSCDVGYTLVGVSQRFCLDNGQWGGSASVCIIKDCGALSDPADGVVSTPVTTYGATAVYSCDAGYYLIGAENRTCQHDSTWSDTAPGCARKDCGEPAEIENGYYTVPTGTQYGDTAVYSCNATYGLVGTAIIGCLSTGEWSTLPSCSQDCETPPSIDNGNFTTPSDTLIGSVVTYTCNDGYYMVRDENITCQGQGAWTKPPGCKLIPKAYNEECLDTAQCVTDRATCRTEDGVTRCLCNASGQMYDASVDSCLADCGPLADPLHGSVTLPPVTSEGQIAVYSCDLNFALDLFDLSLAIRTCSSSGQWNGTAPECTEGCQPPVPPNHGYVSAPNGYARAYKIHYSCAPGYVLHGNTDRDCLAATLYAGGQDYWLWGNTDPVCLIECPVLSDIENGNVDMSKGRTEGSVATYICENNYALIGKPVRKCLPTGRWKGVEPVCIIAIFPDILMAIGAVMIFLVILDILGILFCVYRKFVKKKKDKNKPKYYTEDGYLISDADDANGQIHPGIQRSSFRSLGPGRDSFRGYGQDNGNLEPGANKSDGQHTPRIEQARSTLPRPRKPEDENNQNFDNEQFPFEPPYGPHHQPGYPNSNYEQTAEADFDNFLQKEFQPQNFDENEFLGPNLDDDELSIDLPGNNFKEEKKNLKNLKDLKVRNRSKGDRRPITKLEDASTLFKGRMSLPKGPGVMKPNPDERYYTDDARRYLRETVETYTPINSNQPQSK